MTAPTRRTHTRFELSHSNLAEATEPRAAGWSGTPGRNPEMPLECANRQAEARGEGSVSDRNRAVHSWAVSRCQAVAVSSVRRQGFE